MNNSFLLKSLQNYTRHFPIDKGKRRVIKQFSKQFHSENRIETTLLFNNLRLKCDLSKYMQQQLFFFGAYEEEDCRWWMKKALDSSVIFDVGANIGLYSLISASSNPKAKVHAFEPTPWLSAAINEVADKQGEMFLNFCNGEDGSNEGMNFVSDTPLYEEGEATQVVTIDSYCEQRAIKSIDLMKIDVEGGEFAVLSGARRLLENQQIRCIMLELIEWAANRSGYSIVDVKHLLVEHGYQVFALEEGQLNPLSVEGTKYQGNIVALASA